jgi:hypothetical protein
MMNENDKFAFDREQGKIGIDDNYEYKLYGSLSSGKPIYEPATNSMYNEFRLKSYEVRATTPPSIFSNNYTNIRTRNVIDKPEIVDITKWQDAPTSYYSSGAGVTAPIGTYAPPVMPAAPAAPVEVAPMPAL